MVRGAIVTPKVGRASPWKHAVTSLRIVLRRTFYGGCLGYCFMKYIVEVVNTEGPSMLPTVVQGDMILLEHLSIYYDSLTRDDIVALRSPVDPRVLLCKRITAVEGDAVAASHSWKEDGCIPQGHVWVEGDNRDNSQDSNAYGPVPKGLIVGRLVYRIWPLNRLGNLSNHWFFDRRPPR